VLSVDRARLLNDEPRKNAFGTRPALRNRRAPLFVDIRPGIGSRGGMSLSNVELAERQKRIARPIEWALANPPLLDLFLRQAPQGGQPSRYRTCLSLLAYLGLDLSSRGNAGDQAHAVRHIIDPNAHGDALSKT